MNRTDASLHLLERHPTRECADVDERTTLAAIMQSLQEILSEQNVCESKSADEEGFYFVVEGRRDVSVHYQRSQKADATSVSALLPIQIAMLKCCEEMARRGHTTTLILSPRTFALYVSPVRG